MLIKSIGNDRYLINQIDDSNIPTLNKIKDVPGIEIKLDYYKKLDALVVHRSHIPVFKKEFKNISFSQYPKRTQNSRVSLPYTLRDYQEEAVQFILERSGSLLLHDMGMGKTGIVLVAAQYPALVMVPTTAIRVWGNEAINAGLSVQVLQGRNASVRQLSFDTDLFILTYGSALDWMPYFKQLSGGPKLKTVIADEAHYLQKLKTLASQAFRIACEQRIMTTATPVPNRLASFWGLLDAASKGSFGYHNEYRQRYCSAVPGEYGGFVDGLSSNTEELAARVQEVSIRRTWDEPGFSHLRPKLVRERIELDVPLDDRIRLNDEAIQDVFTRMKTTGNNAGSLRLLTALRRRLGLYKAQAVLDAGMFDKASSSRTVIFCYHKDAVRLLAKGLMEKCNYCPIDVLTGDSNTRHRSTILEEWEYGTHQPRILIASLGVAAESVNLVTANTAYFLEMDWAPRRIIQAEARHHRPGNKNETVHAYYITIKGTIEDRISMALLDKVEDHEAALGRDGQRDQIMTLFSQDDRFDSEDPLEDLAYRLTA